MKYQRSPEVEGCLILYTPVRDRLYDDGRRKDVILVAPPVIGIGKAAEDPESPVGEDDAGGEGARRGNFEVLGGDLLKK